MKLQDFSSDIEIIWGWPFSTTLNISSKPFADHLHEYLVRQFPHYVDDDSAVKALYGSDEWFVDVGMLSTPERSKIWDWIEEHGLTNGEA